MINLRALGDEIKRLREARGLTQEELATRMGIHRNTIHRYEGGDDMPVMLLVRLIVELDADVSQVMGKVLKGAAR